MSDSMKWIKLSTNLLTDPKFVKLSPGTWAFWVRLLLVVGVHGHAGRVETPSLTRAASMLNADPRYFESHLRKLAKLNVLRWETKADGGLNIEVVNWRKYQSSPGGYMETPTGRLEETRIEKKKDGEPSSPVLSRDDQNNVRSHAEGVFKTVTGLEPPVRKKEAGELWWTPLRELCELAQWKPEWVERLIRRAIDELAAGAYNIGSPKSLLKTARSIVARANIRQNGKDVTVLETREVIGWDRFSGELLFADD